MENLKYCSTESYHEGIVVEVSDGAIGIDLKGRLGYIKLPRRMVISDWEIKVGMEVGFMMSYPEILREEVNEEYKKIIDKREVK